MSIPDWSVVTFGGFGAILLITLLVGGSAVLVWKYKKITGLFVLFSAIYLIQAVFTEPDQAALDKYNISAAQAVLLGLTIAIPYVVIWFFALLGYVRLRFYTESIRHSEDGEAFTMISRGVAWLALWLPVSAVAGGLVSRHYTAHPEAAPLMVMLNNYLNLALLFPAFLLTYLGATKLLGVVKRLHAALPPWLFLVFIAFAALYTFLVLHDPARQVPTDGVTVAAYYLPDWLIVTSFVIPRLIMWFLGIQAVYYVYLYSRKIKGSIYRQALSHLAQGIGGVVLATIVLRGVQSLSSPLSQANLAVLLIIIYLLLIVLSVGYVLIAKGARNLQRLEDL